MTLLEGVERAMHATAKRHNQLVELEKKKKKEEEEEGGRNGQGDGEEGGGKSLSRHSSRVISRQTSWAERKRRQSFSRKK